MRSTYFFAAQADAHAVLGYLLADLGCEALDAYSAPGQPLGRYRTAAEVCAAYPAHPASGGHARPVHLMLWRADLGPEPLVRRIELAPSEGGGHAFRYAASGWGLLGLQLGAEHAGRLRPSRFTGHSEAGARRWADAGADRYGPVEAWSWPAIARVARQFNTHVLRHLAVGRQGTWPVLPGAEAALRAGTALAWA